MHLPHDPTDASDSHERAARAAGERPTPYERVPHGEPSPFSRRGFLRTSGLALAGATLYACTGTGRKLPVSSPSPTASVVAQETRWPIKRVVYVMLENRSYDNVFGRFPGSNGTTVGVKFGREVPLTSCPAAPTTGSVTGSSGTRGRTR